MTVDDLRWKKFPVLDDGFVTLVDVMGDDLSVVDAARVSYGTGTKKASDDRNLIRYLYRHGHLTPFEMAEVKLLIRVPIDCMRQWIRHRTASVNEYSTRYSEAIDSATKAQEWRAQATNNKQGSNGTVTEWPEGFEVPRYIESNYRDKLIAGGPDAYLSWRESTIHDVTRELYEERLKFGVAREQARKDLPLSTYTEAYWKCDLRNILNFLSLRMDGHAQKEIRDYATVIGEQIIAPLFPLVWEAFNDYDFRRGGILLSALDIKALKELTQGAVIGCEDGKPDVILEGVFTNKRERAECREKFERMGLI